MQEIVFLIHSEGDFTSADTIPVYEHSLYMEMTSHLTGRTLATILEKHKPPRLLKTHLPAKFFKETLEKSSVKFVVVLRNPKDVRVSLFHFYKAASLLGNFKGTWDEFFELFQADQLVYGNYFSHVLSWWDVRDNPNVLVVKFEDIVQKPTEVIVKVAEHFGKDLSDNLVEKIAERIRFDKMKECPTSNYSQHKSINADISPFMRKGKVGDWRNHFNEEQSNYIDNLYESLCLKKGLTFQF